MYPDWIHLNKLNVVLIVFQFENIYEFCEQCTKLHQLPPEQFVYTHYMRQSNHHHSFCHWLVNSVKQISFHASISLNRLRVSQPEFRFRTDFVLVGLTFEFERISIWWFHWQWIKGYYYHKIVMKPKLSMVRNEFGP